MKSRGYTWDEIRVLCLGSTGPVRVHTRYTGSWFQGRPYRSRLSRTVRRARRWLGLDVWG